MASFRKHLPKVGEMSCICSCFHSNVKINQSSTPPGKLFCCIRIWLEKNRKTKKDKRIKELSKKQKSYLMRLYNSISESSNFAGPQKIFSELQRRKKFPQISLYQIQKFLSKQESYGLSQGTRNKFHRPSYITYFKYYLIQLDLVDMTKYSKSNNNIKYLLSCIDTFSRMLFMQPIKSKQAKDVVAALHIILRQINEPIVFCCTDKGSEFSSQLFKEKLAEYNIKHYFSTTGSCAHVEISHRTIKRRILQHMLHRNTENYIDVLQNIISNYNKTIHSSLNLRPIDVTLQNQYDVYQYAKSLRRHKKRSRFKFKIGDSVRISFRKSIFDRQLAIKWSRETFRVARRYRNQNYNLYKLYDCNNDLIFGSFYENEMKKVYVDSKTTYAIDKVIKKGKDKSLVTFQNYPKKCTEWILNKDIKNVN